MRQADLFDVQMIAPKATYPNLERRDQKRLTGQNARILEMLRERPRTNAELAAVSLKYTSRCSDLRKAGYRLVCARMNDGLTVYTLEN